MTASDIPNLPLSLLGLQETDARLKVTARNHDSHVDCLDALPQVLVKAYEPFAMSTFHYGDLPSVIGNYCWYKENHEVVMANGNIE
eukprot:1144076-Ditylum_brightwellii.AAC.1